MTNQIDMEDRRIPGADTAGYTKTPVHLEGLNRPQREAVKSLDGPLLILAGAGTGKTRALTARLAHILTTRRAWPSQLLAVTFTNKAAAEMRERVSQFIRQSVDNFPWLGTYHAMCAKILRQRAELAGLKQNFTILDTDDQNRLLKQIISAEDLDPKRFPPRAMAAVIDRWKNRGWMPRDVPDSYQSYFDGKGLRIYSQYQERLTILNAVDFGDLILRVVEIFKDHEDVLASYQRRFRYILVDEYQDTNIAQYHWLRLLAQSHRNICCVGDDDQSIYGWRGAEVEYILNFEKDFPGAKIVRLEQNYRSTPHILASASALIGYNRSRLGKTLWTSLPEGEKVKLSSHMDGQDEALWVAGEIEALNAGTGRRRRYGLDEIAVLVRASFQMREIEDRLLGFGIQYRVIGGLRFYERREIRDALAYFRLTVSPSDDLAFERVVNVPKRGIGEKTQQLIRQAARTDGVPFAEAARRLLAASRFPARASLQIRTFLENLQVWSELLKQDELSVREIAGQIVDESGLTGMWQNEKTPDADGRLDNLKELVDAVGEYGSLGGFLEHVALETEKNLEVSGTAVSLMTMHAAKGTEFPVVFLPGWEEETFPSRRALEDGKYERSLEEERRLAYVAITRAKEICMISFAHNRRRFYKPAEPTVPSRFVDELPNKHIDSTGTYDQMGTGYRGKHFDAGNRGMASIGRQDPLLGTHATPGFRRMAKNLDSGRKPRAARRGSSTGKPNSAARFTVGERVFHQKFGYGHIASMEGEAVTIHFEKAGVKQIMAAFLSTVDGSRA